MTPPVPERSEQQVIRWPWQLSVAVALQAFSIVPAAGLLLLFGLPQVRSLGSAVGITLLLAYLAAQLWVLARVVRFPTRPWWLAALAGSVLPLVMTVGGPLVAGERFRPVQLGLALLPPLLLLTPPVRRLVAACTAAAQARRATTTSSSQSIQPVPSEPGTQA